MAEKGTLNEVFDRSSKNWTQPTSFMNEFSKQALNAHRFTRTVTSFVKAHMEIATETWRITATEKPFHTRNLVTRGLSPSSLVSLIDEETRRKNRCACHKAHASWANHFKKGRENRDRCTSARPEWNTHSHSSQHQSLLSDLPKNRTTLAYLCSPTSQ